MTPEQIVAVKSSFSALTPIRDRLAQVFYERLFELDPSLRAMFRCDMAWQRLRLALTLSLLVDGLHNRDAMTAMLRELGRRHVAYGARPEHYRTVGAALLAAIDDCLGDAFTPEVGAAWAALYDLIAATMLEGAAQASARPAA